VLELRREFPLAALLHAAQLPRSTFYYQVKVLALCVIGMMSSKRRFGLSMRNIVACMVIVASRRLFVAMAGWSIIRPYSGS